MKTEKHLMPQIIDFGNALLAYEKARKCKRYRPEVMRFESDREFNLLRACDDLKNGTYYPGRYFVFKVWEPKERIIMALPFYDRVIQHMIVNIIDPIFNKCFISASYACRTGKGAHLASEDFARVLYEREKVQGKRLWAYSGDIRHYFQSVDHEILLQEIARYISDRELLRVLEIITRNNGIWPDGVGIPVGNLTSQLFANVYLNIFDQYVKHELKIRDYFRYMDNFIALFEDPADARAYGDTIGEFLETRLRLALNPKSTVVYTRNGVDFVGYRHWAGMTILRKSSMRRITKTIRQFESGLTDVETFDKRIGSMIGHAKHADAYIYLQDVEKKIKAVKDAKTVNTSEPPVLIPYI